MGFVTKKIESPLVAGAADPDEVVARVADTASPNGDAPSSAHENTTGGNKPKARAKRATTTLLDSKPPPSTASHEVAAAWLTAALRVQRDPVAKVERYGSHEDARTVIILRSGLRITFDRARDLFDPHVLVRRVVIATTASVPPYGYPDTVQIATVTVALSELAAESDLRDEASEWADDFLAIAARNTIEVDEMKTPAGRWRALSNLRDWTPPLDLPPYAPAADRSVILLDTRTGTRYVRTSDFAAHVRGHHGVRVAWGDLHSRMVEIGWRHLGEVQQRQPGGSGRVKNHLYAIPGEDDRSAEQVAVADDAATAGTSPPESSEGSERG